MSDTDYSHFHLMRSMTGAGLYRLSWWDPDKKYLAGIELWPDTGDGFNDAAGHMVFRVADPRTKTDPGAESRLGFRRRCAWCGVMLRAWQLNMCRRCRSAEQGRASAPCGQASRWREEPDRWRTR